MKEYKGYVYRITNKVNNKIYIGQTKRPDTRPFEHLNKPKITNQRFRSSILHYGKENCSHRGGFHIVWT